MPCLQPSAVACNGAGHVHGHAAVNSATHDRLAEARMAPDLLGHREGFQPVLACLCREGAGISFNGIQVQHIGVCGDLTLLVERHGGFNEGRVAADQQIKKHIGLQKLATDFTK